MKYKCLLKKRKYSNIIMYGKKTKEACNSLSHTLLL